MAECQYEATLPAPAGKEAEDARADMVAPVGRPPLCMGDMDADMSMEAGEGDGERQRMQQEHEEDAMSTDTDNPLPIDRDLLLTALLMAADADPKRAMRETSNRFQQIREYHNTSHAAAKGAWLWAWRFCDVLSILKRRSAGVAAVSYKTSLALVTKDLPAVRITTVHCNLLTGGYEEAKDEAIYPACQYEDSLTWQLAYDIAECSLKDVVRHFRRDHPQMATPLSLVLSLDGVPESNSGSRCIDVLSVKVEGCVRVYPLKIIRPNDPWAKKLPHPYTLDIQRKMGNVMLELRELAAQGIAELRLVVADAPMRAAIRQQKPHGAFWACDYCLQRATHIGQVMAFPYQSGDPAPPRTTRLFREKADLRDEMPLKDRERRSDELLGVIGRSPLLELADFDVVGGVGADPMHLVYLGVVKRTLALTFKIRTFPVRRGSGQRLDVEPLSFLLLQTRVPSEFPRRTREYDPLWKASEYRNLLVAMFPLVIGCLDEDKPKREIWLLLAFLVRACIVSDAEYGELSAEFLKMSHRQFYQKYQKEFGATNCTYNLHVMSHLQEIRRQGRLQNCSAFPFEASYAIIKNSYHPGATSHGKQAIYSVMAKYCGVEHECGRSLTLETHKTSKKDNSIVYTRGNRFFRLQFAGDERHPDFLAGREIPTGRYQPGPIDLPWHQVGVYTVAGSPTGEEVTMRRSDVLGKGIIVAFGKSEVILTLPTDFLQEAT
jgi:hypothetical protein